MVPPPLGDGRGDRDYCDEGEDQVEHEGHRAGLADGGVRLHSLGVQDLTDDRDSAGEKEEKSVSEIAAPIAPPKDEAIL